MDNISIETLMLFYSEENSSIGKPLKQNGYIYATDSHVMIRVKDSEVFNSIEESISPNCKSIFDFTPKPLEIDTKSFFESIDTKEGIKEEEKECTCIECPSCDGYGYIDVEHEYINPRTKSYESVTIYDVDCPVCDSINDECPQHGNGSPPSNRLNPIEFDGKNFNKDYMTLIKKVLGENINCSISSNNENFYIFESDGVEILTMSWRR